ncbi:hypothetical protein B0H11DRAFT_920124 [Mycena galericulata]|nr:hypothetical protein B0H11DRAFT_920124 [Mycena galericulata]
MLQRLVLRGLCGRSLCTKALSRPQYSRTRAVELIQRLSGSFHDRAPGKQSRGQHTISASPELDSAERLGLNRNLSTLVPAFLTASDYLDLSGLGRVHVRFTHSADGKGLGRKPSLRLFYSNMRTPRYAPSKYMPFPKYARGFLYVGTQPGLPHLAASIRFRCTTTLNPSSFNDGYDLLLPNGLPWEKFLVQMSTSPSTAVVREQLLREGQLSPQVLAAWQSHPRRPKDRREPMLFRLHQLFPVHFEHVELNFSVVGEDEMRTVSRMKHVFSDNLPPHRGPKRNRPRPFKGSALVHFELNPTNRHILHLRIAKLLEPVSLAQQDPPPPESDSDPARVHRVGWPRSPPQRLEHRPGPEVRLSETWMMLPREGALHAFRTVPFSDTDAAGARHTRDANTDTEGTEPWAFDLRANTPNAEALRMLVRIG